MQRSIRVAVALTALVLSPGAWGTTAAAGAAPPRAHAAVCHHVRAVGEAFPSETCPVPIGTAIRPGLAAVAAAAAVVAAECLKDPRCRHDDYTRKYEEHHIVAQRAGSLNEPRRAPKAAPARAILARFGILVNDPGNLVGLTTGFHRRLHTTAYYAAVNKTVEEAAPYGLAGILYALAGIVNDLVARDAAFTP